MKKVELINVAWVIQHIINFYCYSLFKDVSSYGFKLLSSSTPFHPGTERLKLVNAWFPTLYFYFWVLSLCCE